MISPATIAGLACAAVISLLAPFAMYRWCRKRMPLPARALWLGAMFYLVFAVVLEGALHLYLLRWNPVTAAFFATSLWGYVVYLSAAAALFEETARLIVLRYLVRGAEGPGTAAAYGIGHGGFESISVALVQAGGAVVCLLAVSGRLEGLFGPLLTSADVIKSYASVDFWTALLGGTERITALLAQIGFSLLVWRAVTTRKVRWFVAALLAHFTLDVVAFLAAKGVYPVTTLEIGLIILGLVLIGLYVGGAPKRIAAPELKPALGE